MKVKKLQLALQKAQNDLISPSAKSAVAMTSAAAYISDQVDSGSESECDSKTLNKKKQCLKCKKNFGACNSQSKWRGCEECTSWLCPKCFPRGLKLTDEYVCVKCVGKHLNNSD